MDLIQVDLKKCTKCGICTRLRLFLLKKEGGKRTWEIKKY